MRLFKIVIFRLKLGFLSIYLPIFFFQNYPKLERNILSEALYPNFWRYIRIIFRFTKKEAEVRKALPFGPARYIRSLRRYTPQQIGFSKNPKVPPFTISNSLSFLSLRYGADFGRSRLVHRLQLRIMSGPAGRAFGNFAVRCTSNLFRKVSLQLELTIFTD